MPTIDPAATPPLDRIARLSVRVRLLVLIGIVALLGGALMLAMPWLATAIAEGTSTAPALSCDWPSATITGGSDSERGTVRCYLRALAEHDEAGMKRVSRDGTAGPTAFAFAHSAAAGTTRVGIAGNDVDTADAFVTFRFADGRTDQHEMHLADPMSGRSWRLTSVNAHGTTR
jgi:hypothetical protein